MADRLQDLRRWAADRLRRQWAVDLRLAIAALVIGLVALLVVWTIVASTFIVDRRWWGWNGWAAIAAVAQVFAAIGTVGALLFLWLQFASLRGQVQLDQQRHREALQAARPRLETSVSRVNPMYFNVAISWVQGTQPAFDVTVWVKQLSGVYVLSYGTLPAQSSRSERRFWVVSRRAIGGRRRVLAIP